MALVLRDRCKETTSTTGTGTLNLNGVANASFQTFVAAIGNGNTCYYCISNATDFEIGIGTVTDAAPDTLSRDTVLQSSNADAKVNWAAGTKDVFAVYPADKAVYLDASGSLVAPAASETVTGPVELATNAETATGTDAARVPPVSALASAVAYQGLQTIWIPAGAMTPATTNGAASGSTELATNKNMLKTLDFDTATQEFAQFDIAMPKSWNQGTVTFVPRWTAASGSGGVVWALQAVGTRDDDAMDVAFGTEQTSTDTLITANDCHVGPTSSAITVAGTLTSPLRVNFRIKRNVADGSDTLGVDAKLIGIHVLYSTNVKNDV